MNKYLLLGVAGFIGISIVPQSAMAVIRYEVTEIQTFDDGSSRVYNNSSFDYEPQGLNPVQSFKVNNGTTETTVATTDFVPLIMNDIDTPFVIQHKSANCTDPSDISTCSRLYSSDSEYLYEDGLSLSTGINKITNQDQEILTFPVININTSSVGGTNDVDFFFGDIANNQSADKLEFYDASDEVVASLTLSDSDWNVLGQQDLRRVNTATGDVLEFDNRNVAGLALELSDFELPGGGSLTSAEAGDIESLKIFVADDGVLPRTDYAFFAADTNSIQFAQGTSSVAVPFGFSPALGLISSGIMFGIIKKIAQIRQKQD